MSANLISTKRYLSIIPLTIFAISCGDGDGNQDAYSITFMSGEIDTSVTFDDLTEVRVSEDLSFHSTESPGLRINGRVRFVLDPDVTITLPKVTETSINADWLLVSRSASWNRVIVPTDGALSANKMTLEGSQGGLHFQDGTSGDIEELRISNSYAGLTLNGSDTLTVQSIDISSCEIGVDITENSYLILRGGFISSCTTGIKNTESAFLATDMVFSSCSFYAIWTTLERLTSIEHSRFYDNKDHLFIQNNRNVQISFNNFDDTREGGYPFHIFYTMPEYCEIVNNNIIPSPTGWYVNLRSGSLEIVNNYWTTADSSTIFNGFLDGHNDANKTGVSSFYPYLTSRVLAGPR